MPLHKQTPQIRPPRVPRPPQHLLQEPPIGLHCAQQLSLLADLDIGVPPVADHPASQKLVVARIELVLSEPIVVREAVQEFGVFQNDGPVGGGTTR